MRWLPSLSFSHHHHHHGHGHGLKSSSASSSLSPSDVDHHKKKSTDSTRGSGGVWPFGTSKKTSHSKKLRPTADVDGKSPPRGHDSCDDVPAPLVHSPTPFDRQFSRSNTTSSFSPSVAPQPLPLPDSALSRQRDADCPLPSPNDVPGPSSSAAAKGAVERDRADAVMAGVSSVFRIRR